MKKLYPIMIPDLEMVRYHEVVGTYLVSFSRETIDAYRKRFHKNGFENNLNVNHKDPSFGTKITDSFLIDAENKEKLPAEFQNFPLGTWMIEMEYTPEAYANKLANNLTGLSGEIKYQIEHNGIKYDCYEKFRAMNKLSDKVPFNLWVKGGSTEGFGRNEHGEAHFELKEKGTNNSIGKIFMPTMELWLKSNDKERINLMTLYEGKDRVDISTKEKKVLVTWLSIDSNINLKNSHNEWNRCNKDNNRVVLI